MGEQEQTNQEQAPPPADKGDKAAPPEEKKEEQPPPAEEAPKEAEAPKPPPPFVLYVDLHCVGCAKKMERSIMKLRGVEGVEMDMAKNEVTIKGVVEPEAICNMIKKRTRRMAKVLSPLPASDGDPIPDVVASQVSGLVTVELNVNMHCEACADQLKKKILKMRGVKSAETEFSSGKVTVTGTMDADKLVDYVYRRTKKQAKIVPQPEPEKPAEEPEKPAEEDKKEEAAEEKPAAEGEAPLPPALEEPKKEGGEIDGGPPPMAKMEGPPPMPIAAMHMMHMPMPMPMMSLSPYYGMEEERMERMQMMHHQYNYYPPMYAMDRLPPPPQLFSDENPNACSIS